MKLPGKHAARHAASSRGQRPAACAWFAISGLAALSPISGAQTAPKIPPTATSKGPSIVTTTVTTTQINGDSGAYHLDWNGTSGTLTRHALGNQPEVRLPLLYLHSEPGPTGSAKYLAWFLARDKDHFSLAWCYLNESGNEFYCWLYQYPTNQLTVLRFVGDYRFIPAPEPVAPTLLPTLATQIMPLYTGPDFTYRDWKRRSGTLTELKLSPTHVDTAAAPLSADGDGKPVSGNRDSGIESQPSTLTNLRVYPLHEIHVAKGNGWRVGGWRELHAIAYDSANDPYYLILYSNVTQGYVVDLKRAQTYVADFGQKVVFSNNNTTFGEKEEVVMGPPEARIRRFGRMEIPLVTTHKYDNPFTNVFLNMNFRAPDGKVVSIPGFWDGGQTWRVRFVPTMNGPWTWTSTSNDPEIDNQTGKFTCIVDDTGSKGFVTVADSRMNSHAFVNSNGTPFLPVFLRDPVHYLPAPGSPPNKSQPGKKSTQASDVSLMLPLEAALAQPVAAAQAIPGGANDAESVAATGQTVPGSFAAFSSRVDEAAALGFNRFWGGWLLDPLLFAQHTQVNEGGAPFTDYNLDTLNPAYFQWMDRRVAYCNEHGIVPDIGLTEINAPFLAALTDDQVTRLWRYVLARYASFNVCWNLFGKSFDAPYPPDMDTRVATLAKMTGVYDPLKHPLTTVVANVQPLPAVPPTTRPSGPIIFTPNGLPLNTIPSQPLPPGSTASPSRGAGAPQTNNPAVGTPPSGPGVFPNRQAPNVDSQAPSGTPQPPSGAPQPPFGNRQGANPNRFARAGQGRRRPGGMPGSLSDATNSGGDDDYVVIVDPDVAAAMRADRKTQRGVGNFTSVPIVRFGSAPWLNVVTLSGGDTSALAYDYSLNKPLVLQDLMPGEATDATRYRLWETVMHGGFWAGSVSGNAGTADPVNSTIARWELASAKLFGQTRYPSLVPHQDMLGGPTESPFARRRRKRAEADAAQSAPNPPSDTNPPINVNPGLNPKSLPGSADASKIPGKAVPNSDDANDVGDEDGFGGSLPPVKPVLTPGPIYVLADPGWEYVVYFQRGGSVTLDLLEAIGTLRQSWFNPRTGQFASQDTMRGGIYKTFVTPDTNDWVLYLTRR